MKPTTLCFVVTDTQILLGRKKRGFGADKMNGFGGKREGGETFRQCAVRELFEEVGLVADPVKLDPVGLVDFRFPFKPEYSHVNYVYLVKEYSGTPLESEEMEPQWYPLSSLPYDHMWEGDVEWVSRLLKGEKLEGYVTFGEDNSSVIDMKFNAVDKVCEMESVEEIHQWLPK